MGEWQDHSSQPIRSWTALFTLGSAYIAGPKVVNRGMHVFLRHTLCTILRILGTILRQQFTFTSCGSNCSWKVTV